MAPPSGDDDESGPSNPDGVDSTPADPDDSDASPLNTDDGDHSPVDPDDNDASPADSDNGAASPVDSARASSQSDPSSGGDRQWRAQDRDSPSAGQRREPPSATQRRDPPTAKATSEEREPVLKEISISVLAVVLVGAYLFMISGVWPPMVAVESGSMEPHMNVNDLVFVMDSDRFEPSEAHGDTGVVTARAGRTSGYEQFGGPGDVIVFAPNGNEGRTPIIHRAMFWVEEGERWVEDANPEYLGGAESCSAVSACPAPHDGFITKGDNNPSYDQAGSGQFRGARASQFEPVKPAWVVGTAEVRIPGVGWLRLRFQ